MIRPPLLALLLAPLLAPLAGVARAEVEAAITMPSAHDEAARQVSVTVTPGLTRTASLPTEALRQARRDMLEGLEVADDDLRALADRGDGLAAQRLVRRLLEGPGGPAAAGGLVDSDVAYYGAVAVGTGRVWTLPEAVEAMRRLDPATEPPERVRAHMAMLYPHAWAGNALALEALIDLNGEGRLFGPLSAATRERVLEQGDRAGDGRAALRLALKDLQEGGPTNLARDDLARDALARAMAGDDLAVQAVADNLLALLDADPAPAAP